MGFSALLGPDTPLLPDSRHHPKHCHSRCGLEGSACLPEERGQGARGFLPTAAAQMQTDSPGIQDEGS